MIPMIDNWFERPYPLLEDIRIKLSISLLVGITCFLFLLIHQPFGLATIDHLSTYLIGFGCNGTIGMLLGYFLLPRLRPVVYRDERYTVKDEFIFFVFVLTCISVINVVYNSTVGRDFSPQYGLLPFVGMTISVGIIPIFLVIFITEKFSRNARIEEASEVNSHLLRPTHVESHPSQYLTLKGVLKSDAQVITTQHLWCYIKADANYVEVFFLNDAKEVERVILRCSLKDIEGQLMQQDIDYLRCHKSYLINPVRILKVEGNARSLYVHLKDISMLIPVSRSFDRSLLTSGLS